jgi:hypothetical protein
MIMSPAPATDQALAFYERAQPLAEQMLAMAQAWRDEQPYDQAAIEAHSEMIWLAIRTDLRLARHRGLEGTPCA